jgi:hypothetical protein
MSKSKKNNKNYIRASEWKEDYGGKKDQSTYNLVHYLPLNCCCLSMQPFTTPGFFFILIIFSF